jgi:alkylhydroperoxidase family enzyme
MDAHGRSLSFREEMPMEADGHSIRIQLVKPDEASDEVREVYEDIIRTKGAKYLTPTWGFFAHDPELLRHWWGLTKRLQSTPGEVEKPLMNSISLVCAAEVNCPRCINNHQTHLMDHFGMSPQYALEIIDFENSDQISPHWKAVLRFARKVAFGEETTDEDLQALRNFGYTDRGIVEIVSMAFLESSMARRAVGVAKFADGELWPQEHLPSDLYRQNVHA